MGRQEKSCSTRRQGAFGQVPSEVKEANYTREHVLRQFWQSFVDDRLNLEKAIQTKADFSYAIAVMDKIGGWGEENWIGSRFAACT